MNDLLLVKLFVVLKHELIRWSLVWSGAVWCSILLGHKTTYSCQEASWGQVRYVNTFFRAWCGQMQSGAVSY